jgi:histidine triad (HIT) family protein
MQDSVFTKIINGEIPAQKIYEDEATLAFLDIHPSQPGHTLVIPKKQVEFVWDLDSADYQALMATVQKVGKHIREVLGVPYVGVKVIGTDVPHTHVHLVPFTTPDQYAASADPDAEPDFAALDAMAKKLAL